MPKKEYNTAKTIAMLLVVFGHAQVFSFGNVTWDFPMNAFRMQLENVISFVYCFHVHLFFFVSGALFKTTEAKQMSCGILPFIQKKASRLLLPYLGCFVFLLVPVRYLVGYYPSNWTESMKAVLGELIGLGDNGHLWFLPTLFLDYVLFYCIEKISKRHHTVGILTSAIVLYLSAFLIPDRFDTSIRYLLWFTGGYFFDTICYDRMRQMQAKVLILASASCLFTAFFLFHIQKKLTGIVTIPISMLTTALGICSILFLAYVCAEKQSKLSRILEKYSYSVYIFHDPVNYLFLFVVGRLICTSTLSEGQYAVVIILKIMASLLLAIGMRQCVGILRKQFARHYSF